MRASFFLHLYLIHCVLSFYAYSSTPSLFPSYQILTFSRYFNTCDSSNTDRVLEPHAVQSDHFIYAYNNELSDESFNADNTDFTYHNHRGSKNINLLRPPRRKTETNLHTNNFTFALKFLK